MRKNEDPPLVTTWMNHESVKLSRRARQLLCDLTYMRNLKLVATERRKVVTRG